VNGLRIDPQRLLLERCRCGLSQAALARKARLAYLTVSRIERDHAARVRATTAYKLALALALEVDIEQLMTPITSPASQAGQGGRRRVTRPEGPHDGPAT
jgi:transcriptional regulator with XRE-family HTH domain